MLQELSVVEQRYLAVREALDSGAAITDIAAHLVDGQILVLRSTVYPGVTAMVERLIELKNLDVDVAFCPERIAEGKAMMELSELPQIVAARSPQALERATKLFPQVKQVSAEGSLSALQDGHFKTRSPWRPWADGQRAPQQIRRWPDEVPAKAHPRMHHVGAADADFSDLSRRQRFPFFSHDAQVDAGKGGSDGSRDALLFRVERDHRAGFGEAVALHERDPEFGLKLLMNGNRKGRRT